MASHSVSSDVQMALLETTLTVTDQIQQSHDVMIHFHSAEGIPKMDAVGHADPYFVATIDDAVTFTSAIVRNTGNPMWQNETWIVCNIPGNAKLLVKVYDKDDDKVSDDYIGQFEIRDLNNYTAPPEGHKIIGSFGRSHGYFHLSIHSVVSSEKTKLLPRYAFDGPCRYLRYDSLTAGRHVTHHTDRDYPTWRIYLRRIPVFFGVDRRPQAKLSKYPLKRASYNGMKLAHRALHNRSVSHDESARLTHAHDLWSLIFAERTTGKLKPCLYTFIIDENTWRFSQIDAQSFTDFASKHVRCAGEFHARPLHGWHRGNGDEWELVFDNGSDASVPDQNSSDNLKELLQFNFPDLNIVMYSHKDPRLTASVEALKQAAKDLHGPPPITDNSFSTLIHERERLL